MDKLMNFLKNQKLLALACHNEKEIWSANVYFAADNKGTLYFVSQKDAKHSTMILQNPNISFSVAWFDPMNNNNRKGVQGLGICRQAEGLSEITTGIALLYKNFPDLRSTLTIEWILTNAWGAKIWVVQPSYMKYWDDEEYKEEESKEFSFE